MTDALTPTDEPRPERAIAIAEVRMVLAGLAEVYKPEGVLIWMNGANKLLGGEVPWDLIARGETDRVYAVIDMLITGAFA